MQLLTLTQEQRTGHVGMQLLIQCIAKPYM